MNYYSEYMKKTDNKSVKDKDDGKLNTVNLLSK
jgi:hypothetical protein